MSRFTSSLRIAFFITILGLLVSCGNNHYIPKENDPIIPESGTSRRTVTAQDIATGEVTGGKYVAGELLIYLKNSNDQAEFIKLLAAKKWTVVSYDEPLNLYTVQTDAKSEAILISYIAELKSISYIYGTDFNGVSTIRN